MTKKKVKEKKAPKKRSFFASKKSVNEKRVKKLSDQTYIYRPVGQTNRHFVFGLHWHVILGSDLDKEAYKVARKLKANYYLRGTTRSNVVGLLQTNRENGHPDLKYDLYSMAAVFARTLPQGSFVMRFNTPKGIWFMMAHDGVVQEGTDCFYQDQEEVDVRIAEFKAQWSGLLVYGDQEGDLSVPELPELMGQINAQTRLRRASINLATIPRWVWFLAIAFTGYQAYDYGSKEWRKYKIKKEKEMMSLIRVDPVKEWSGVINRWAVRTPVLGTDGLNAWEHAIGAVPAYVGRWELDRLVCDHSGYCTGLYLRMPLGLLDSFKAFMPQDWEFESLGLNDLRVRFKMDVPEYFISDIGLDSLPKAEPTKWDELNLFQRITPVIRDVKLSSPQPVKLQPPKQPRPNGGSEDVPFPKDSSLIYPYLSKFQAEMPLRSLIMLDWQKNYIIERLELKRVTSDITKKSGMFDLLIEGGFYVKE